MKMAANEWTSLRQIKDSAYNGEYHLFDGERIRPGWVGTQWTGRTLESIRKIPKPELGGSDSDWTLMSSSMNTLQIVFPKTKSHSVDDYRLLMSFMKNGPDDVIIIKAAIQHKLTDDVVLLTAYNKNPPTAAKDSITDGWYVLTSDMIAPAIFWDTLDRV
jgi:hypothetical protein